MVINILTYINFFWQISYFQSLIAYPLVSNKWIHERGQEFRRPCSLKETDWSKPSLVFLMHSSSWTLNRLGKHSILPAVHVYCVDSSLLVTHHIICNQRVWACLWVTLPLLVPFIIAHYGQVNSKEAAISDNTPLQQAFSYWAVQWHQITALKWQHISNTYSDWQTDQSDMTENAQNACSPHSQNVGEWSNKNDFPKVNLFALFCLFPLLYNKSYKFYYCLHWNINKKARIAESEHSYF